MSVLRKTNDDQVFSVEWLDRLDGFLAVVMDKLSLFRPCPTGLEVGILLTGLPVDRHDFGEVAGGSLFLTEDSIVVCTENWLRVYGTEGLQLGTSILIAGHNRRAIRSMHLRSINGQPCIRFVSEVHKDPVPDYLYRSIALDGREGAALSVEMEGVQFNPLVSVVPGEGGRSLALIDSEAKPLHLTSIHRFTSDMLVYCSKNGSTFAGAAPNELCIWKDGVLAGTFSCDGTWYNVRLSDDGAYAVLLYCTGMNGPNVAGVVDLSRGRVVGQCRGHMCGMSPYAFSPSSKYFASVITHNDSLAHPEGLPSGTVVLTKLPAHGA